MSRDRRDPSELPGGAPGDLVTAYVDGVAELPIDERRAIEARLEADPAARAEAAGARQLLDRLRALPADGDEPDWSAMERSIRLAVAAEPIRPWWRRWTWLVPAMTCATAAAVLIVLWPRSATVTQPARTTDPVAAPASPPAPAPPAPVFALWLDGSELEVDLSAPGDPLAGLEPATLAGAAPGDADDSDDTGLLPAADLAWVDRLDDAALDRAERWLASAPRAGTPPSFGRKKS
ncbi:MAG TPA: hypothetical protein VK607_07210 [Kofleriaceae bacterium]|nr:hypothetical protein [Kofleriaceae bacterium]